MIQKSPPDINNIESLFKQKNSILLTSLYKNNTSNLEFLCSVCNAKHFITWSNFQQGVNPHLLCPDCSLRARYDIPDLQIMFDFFKQKGALLLSKEYISTTQKLVFICSNANCSNEHHTTWSLCKRGSNKDLLCKSCINANRTKHTSIESLSNIFNSKGAILLTKQYINAHQKLEFICSNKSCSNVHSISRVAFKKGLNPNLLCKDCNPHFATIKPNKDFGKSRKLIDNHFYNISKDFYQSKKQGTAAHHIRFYSNSPEQRTNLFNISILDKQEHISYHTAFGKNLQIGDDLKTFKQFNQHFEYLGDSFITEFITTEDQSKLSLKKKKEYALQGIQYFPINTYDFFSSKMNNKKQEIYFSILRNKINQTPHKIYARRLKIKQLSSTQEISFLNKNHLQGYVPSSFSFGLFDDQNEIHALISFGKSRFNSSFQYELLR